MAGTILIVEDEQDLVDILDFNLRREGFQTRRAMSGEEGLRQAHGLPAPDLVLLDLMLPDISGTEVCRRLRSDAKTRGIPVLMLTAKDAEVDRIVGFEIGADDYVTKPFSVRELMLRIRAILRRADPKEQSQASDEITVDRLRISPAAHRVWVDDEEITLTALEFRLLSTLLDRAGRVQTRDTLLTDVWGMHPDVTTRTVDTHVTRLRKKLGPAGAYIETLRGVGYRFTRSPPATRPVAEQ